MKKVLIIFIVLISASSAFAQESNLGNWLIYIGSKKINSKLNLHHEIQYRNYNALGDLEQLLIRTGLGYNLSENNKIVCKKEILNQCVQQTLPFNLSRIVIH